MRIAVLGTCLAAAALVGVIALVPSTPAGASSPNRRERDDLFAIDFTASMPPAFIDTVPSLVSSRMSTLSYGDRVRLQRIHWQDVHDGAFEWSGEAPARELAQQTPAEAGIQLHGFLNGARQNMDLLWAERPVPTDGGVPMPRRTSKAGKRPPLDPKVANTHILATLEDFGGSVRDAASRATTLYLISDMEESTASIEMHAAKKMPPRDWIEQQQKQRLLPHLEHVCIVVVGPDPAAPGAAAIRDWWEQYFKATGADFRASNWVATTTDLSQLGCP